MLPGWALVEHVFNCFWRMLPWSMPPAEEAQWRRVFPNAMFALANRNTSCEEVVQETPLLPMQIFVQSHSCFPVKAFTDPCELRWSSAGRFLPHMNSQILSQEVVQQLIINFPEVELMLAIFSCDMEVVVH